MTETPDMIACRRLITLCDSDDTKVAREASLVLRTVVTLNRMTLPNKISRERKAESDASFLQPEFSIALSGITLSTDEQDALFEALISQMTPISETLVHFCYPLMDFHGDARQEQILVDFLGSVWRFDPKAANYLFLSVHSLEIAVRNITLFEMIADGSGDFFLRSNVQSHLDFLKREGLV